jgi:hypothetical protein
MYLQTQKSSFRYPIFILAICLFVPGQSAHARTWVVDQKNPRASDAGNGSASHPFRTISRAAELAQPGDEVVVHAGIYRERVAPKRGGEDAKPITYTAAPGETVEVKGSDVLKGPFSPIPDGVKTYKVQLDVSVFKGANPFATRAKDLPGQRTLGQIFVDDRPLLEVDSRKMLDAVPGSWMASEGGSSVLIHFPQDASGPQGHLIEYSVRDRVFAPYTRGLGYITVRGFVFEHCANPGLGSFWESTGHQAGMVSTRSGNHWVIENNVIRYAKSLGLDFANEGGGDVSPNPVAQEKVGWHIIRNNVISYNGETGMAGLGSHHVQITGNTFDHNNALGWNAVEEAGLKTHFFFDGLIEGNIFRDNNCSGIWIDNTYHNVRITRNIVLRSLEDGIFVELGFGPILVDNNIVGYTRAGEGIYAHDSSGITIAHNLILANADWGILMRVVTDRQAFLTNEYGPDTKKLAPVETSNERIVNNVIVDNYHGAISLPPEWERSKNNVSDFNVFVTGSQYNWSAVYEPPFAFDNCEGRVSPEKLQGAVFDHAENIPADQLPSRRSWPVLQFLTLEQWRLLAHHDQNSATATFEKASSIDSADRVLVLKIKTFPWKGLQGPRVEGVDRDFLGNPLPEQNPLPGPFQSGLQEGRNRLALVPYLE